METKHHALCIECRHYTTKHGGRIWYDRFCGATPLPKMVDYAGDGVEKPYNVNDLGGVYFLEAGEKPFQYCRDVNTDGNCPKFEQRLGVIK